MTPAVVSMREKNNGLLLSFAVTAMGVACLVKLYKRCFVRVPPHCVTVVYETRRNSILASSMEEANNELPQVSHFRPLMYIVSLLLYRSKKLVIVPPTSFFSTFTLPCSVLDESGDGEVVDCTVEDIHVTDGSVRMVMTIRYCIPINELERYLAAVGPTAPNERIALAAAGAARARGAELSVGLIINKSKRDTAFLEPFRAHLSSKLMSESCVKVLDVVVEAAEIADRSLGG
ncbi:uncharacterized protein TEOVI_000142300 [Trypanosoma equiperdum]|uniref:Uncharacterized protein n=2 Tax=Trypanozoon TaxID=39700 RepID=Q38FH0_TRYB2|nr:hypothetical protein, conserved [Trypanosoma brucei brucei TREU927]EAN76450.1 hypothetical protein, conserved [Trypanosoma brucei brucei TREU927]SCU69854.1 hypothetical protein, conserved [Trypanosoma equiperdum]